MKSVIIEYVMRSDFLQRDQSYQLLHTAAWQELDNCYVLFVQDGANYLEIGQLQQQFEQLLTQYPVEAKQLVMVLVSPSHSMERYSFYHPEGSAHQNFVNFFSKELVPELQQFFATKKVKIKKMGLLGDSLGGTVSLAIACTNPAIWTHLLLQSAAFIPSNHVQARQLIPGVPWQVYQVVGVKEDTYVSIISGKVLHILTHNRSMKEILEAVGAQVTYFEEDEDHLWDFWRRDLPRALSYFLFN